MPDDLLAQFQAWQAEQEAAKAPDPLAAPEGVDPDEWAAFLAARGEAVPPEGVSVSQLQAQHVAAVPHAASLPDPAQGDVGAVPFTQPTEPAIDPNGNPFAPVPQAAPAAEPSQRTAEDVAAQPGTTEG